MLFTCLPPGGTGLRAHDAQSQGWRCAVLAGIEFRLFRIGVCYRSETKARVRFSYVGHAVYCWARDRRRDRHILRTFRPWDMEPRRSAIADGSFWLNNALD